MTVTDKIDNLLSEIEDQDEDQVKKQTLWLYHGTLKKNVDKILKGGFNLSFIKPRWINDYAVSALTTKKAVEKYMRPGTAVLKFKFSGVVYYYEYFGEGPDAARFAKDARTYNRKVVASGIDAARIYSERGPYQYYVYNPKKITNIQVVK